MKRDTDTSIICPFLRVDVLEEPYNNVVKAFENASLEVDQNSFFVADGKWKVSWKKITELRIDDHAIHISTIGPPENSDEDKDDDGKNKKYRGLQVQATVAQDFSASKWPSFHHFVQKKWQKILHKKHRKQDARKHHAEEEARQARRDAAKPKRTRYDRVLKNLPNMETFDDISDDEIFNRRDRKILMVERNEQEEASKEEDEQEPFSNSPPSNDEGEQQETSEDTTGEQDETSPLDRRKARKIKRKVRIEDESDDDDLFGSGGQTMTTPIKKRVVTPGDSLKKKAFFDDDEDDILDESDSVEVEKEENADDENLPTITSYVTSKKLTTNATTSKKKAASVYTNKTEKPESPVKTTAKKAGVTTNFFAPRSTEVAPPPESLQNPPRSNHNEALSIPPRSEYKHMYQPSNQTSQENDGQIMDRVDQGHLLPARSNMASPSAEHISGIARRKREQNFFGTKAPPSRASSVLELDPSDQSSLRRNPCTGLETASPSSRKLTSLASPPRKRIISATSRSPQMPRKSAPPGPVTTSKFRGLRNLGNTCYINSSLQMLFSIPKFAEDLASLAPGRKLVESFCQTFQDVIHPPGSYEDAASAKNLKLAVDQTTDQFRGFQQRDAHEFVGHLIDEVHEEMEQERGDNDEEKKDDSTPSSSHSSAFGRILPTDDYFRLNVEVNLKCKSCGYSRSKEEMYRYLSVDIGDSTCETSIRPTVEGCLESFFQPEDREIKCEKCNDGIEATQTMRILSRPRALLLHLKRFKMVEHRAKGEDGREEVRFSFQKNKTAVELNDRLSLDGYLSEEATASILPSDYSLRSIVHHIGTTANSGHYTADALRQTAEDGKPTTHSQWVSYDDSTSTEITLADVRTSLSNQKTAYMLLYSTE